MNASVKPNLSPAVERGIAALRTFIGEEVATTILRTTDRKQGEAASFLLPLPPDYTGIERQLRIAFPNQFPLVSLRIQVEPSPWLAWPHATRSGLCLHGFRERPITGDPETVVQDCLVRLGAILEFVRADADPALRDTEFEKEFTSYWNMQLDISPQDVLLLERPKAASELFATSDPRPGRRTRTAWLAPDVQLLRTHINRTLGLSAKIKAPAVAGFYLKLLTYPDIQCPTPDRLLEWLTPHLSPDDSKQFLAWFSGKDSLANRWLVLELPGPTGAPLYCLDVRSYSKQPDHGRWYGFRSARRWSGKNQPSHSPVLVRGAILNVLDRDDILSRDLSGTAKSLEKSKVVMVGVGSLGSTVALQLARSGVGELVLIDPDILESANLGRHVLGADDLAQSKATALAEKITHDLPTVKVTAFMDFAELMLLKMPEIFDNADMVLVTTADWSSEVALWFRKAQAAGWNLLQAWSEPHSFVGHALLAPQGQHDGRPLFDDTGNFNFKYTEWPNGGGVVPLPACGQTFIPGGASGMANVASMVTQVALRGLTGQITKPVWTTSIYRPQDIPTHDGTYSGPPLADGVQHIVFERDWPDAESGKQ
ncbi:ThiF family adenylyltransferase [Pseudomonas sp. USTB-Z]|uniref:ThiF family adenylyltransferase n=1 Tax=unclassified Pseudomonas TaxID=196821 RepID=UPI001C82C6B7|nr:MULTISPECIES: ThiF family adenylyltransferase [unclassified Pseudomonas]MBX6691953.1 ThiF family adenylyltransferase [Pseudomonas sp. USTB-Z]MDH0707828.1 ThiF family adenylyltransferase [Pseudomonas sp. GD03862]